MSSRESAASTLDIPVATAADRIATALVVPAAVATAWVCTPYRGVAMSAAMGGVLLVALLAVRIWSKPPAWSLAYDPVGSPHWRVGLPDGSWRPVAIGAGTRLLGRTVVLGVLGPGSGRHAPVWLTGLDVPEDGLRRLAILLATDAPEDRS